MKKVDFTQPEILLKKFAEDGTRNVLPILNTDSSNKQLADLTNGFPTDTQGDPSDGKLPPERADFNALGYLTTSYDFFYQAGGTFTFSSTIATAIGGYPKGARLWHTNSAGVSMILRSTKDDNEDDFTDDSSYIGTSWVIESMIGLDYAQISLFDYKFEDKIINNMSWVRSDLNSWLSNSTYIEGYKHLCDDVGFVAINDNGMVKITVSASDYTAGNYTRSSGDDKTISSTVYYAWKYSEDILYVTLDTSSMSADDAVSSLQGQRIYKYENSDMFLTIHKITAETQDSYEINGNTITLNVLVGSDGHRIVLEENGESTSLDTIYNETGNAWYYLLDKTNQQFKLPRGKKRRIIDTYSVGDNWYRVWSDGWCEQGGYITSSVITVTFKKPFINTSYSVSLTDVAYANNGSEKTTVTNRQTTGMLLSSQAQTGCWWKCSGYIKGVKEDSANKYLYFFLGGFSDNAIEQTAGINAEAFNEKMDGDATNATASGKENVVGWGMPDYSSGVSVNFPFTAPSKGFIIGNADNNNASIGISINGVSVGTISPYETFVCLPIDKNDVFTRASNFEGYNRLVFYPMKGVTNA